MAILLRESSFQVDVLTEQKADGKQLYIEGIFCQSEVKNGNGRRYPKSVLEKAVCDYNEQYVSKRRALGELNHPDRPFADPAESAILIESLDWQGNDVVGKAKVMNTPRGLIIKGLLEAGFNLGVSTRGLGTVSESRGEKIVNSDFMMTAIDAVDGPSGPNCYVNPLTESTWVIKNGVWVPNITEQKQEFDEQLFLESLEAYLKSKKRIN